MAMPTTRRGRFLYYKKRQRNRLHRAASRARRQADSELSKKRATNHPLDLSDFTKQMPRVYPLHFPEKSFSVFEYLLYGWTPPKRKHWGIVNSPPPVGPAFPNSGLTNMATVSYYDRRMKSIPRIHLIAKLPYQFPQWMLTPENVYPYGLYPSGRPSFAFQMGWATID